MINTKSKGRRLLRRTLTCLLAVAVLLSGIPLIGIVPEAYAAGNAAAATPEQIASTRMTNTGYNAMAKIVDGKLYVWGNANTMGISSYQTATGETSTKFPVPFPVQVPESSFDGKVVQVCANWGNLNLALTEHGTVYQLTNTVTKIYESPAGKKIVYLSDVGGRAFFAKDEKGDWYSYLHSGGNSGYYCLTQTAGKVLKPIEIDAYKVALGNDSNGQARKIKEITNMAAYASIIVCTDGTLFTVGYNLYDALGNGQSKSYATAYGELYNVSEALGGVKFTGAVHAEDVSFAAVDTDGNAWGWGCDHTQRFRKRSAEDVVCGHGGSYAITTPVKFFDASIYGKKVVRPYMTTSNVFLLCDDNTVYASGANTNGMISSAESPNTSIFKPTQIFMDVSQKDTIVGLAPTTVSVSVYTLKGDSYFTGSNTSGMAGNGNTTNSNPGEAIEVIPDMPPSKPFTKNGLAFELEVNRIIGNQTKVVTYAAKPTAEHPNQVTKSVAGGTPVDLPSGLTGDEAIPAGQTFKLNVYFEDFGKVHTFLVPIRFNPTYLKVVNAAGERYPESTVTAPIGNAGGIQQTFTSENWQNGSLGSGVEGTYPKVNNKDGWISVLGYSSAYKAQITGKQKMFSVAFTAIGATPINIFTDLQIATQSNRPSNGDPGFDVGSKQAFDYGAYWSINNPYSEEEVTSYDFVKAPFPGFNTTVKSLQSLSLDIVRGAGETVDSATDVEGASPGSKAINNKNKDVVYTVKVKTNPEDASFPQVNWTVTLMAPTDGTVVLTDYATIVEQKDTYIKFKLPDSFSQVKIGQLRFHAAAKINPALTSTLDVYVKSFDPPQFIHIKEKEYNENKIDGIPAVIEKIYGNKLEPEDMEPELKENRKFTVQFPTVADGTPMNKLVNWKLLDSSGNPLDPTKDTCPVRIVTSTPATDSTEATVTIQPLRTTYGEDYVTLRVESLYDPNVTDTIKIKVRFKASELKFKQEIVRLPFNMGKDLADLLEVAPQDVYKTDLEWSFTPMNTTTAYINFNGTGSITSNDIATPLSPTPQYEKITVKDKVSGKTADIKISVIDLDSPLNIDDIISKNLLGTKDDTIEIKANLQVGDVIRFYNEYGSETAFITTGQLTEAQTPYFKFAVPGLLDSSGGEIAVSVERIWGDGGRMETSRMPVSYAAEPSKVYGYVALAGKSQNSAINQGIRVDIDGIGGSQTVYTDENGRFEFTEYIKPGTYTLTLSQTRYLTRSIAPNKKTGYQGLVVPATEEFLISAQNGPIKLYPGDVNMDNIIDYRDLDIYVKNWVGQINPDLPDFDLFDFSDREAYAAIGTDDLNLLLIHYGWANSKYANWITPEQ